MKDVGGAEMLIQFRFENFKSFRDDTYLDMTSTGISEHPEHVITFGTEKILPLAGIFGANASGKSNVIEALRFMRKYVLNSVQYGGDPGGQNASKDLRSSMPFLLDDSSRKKPTLFEVYFTAGAEGKARFYNYGFTLDQNGILEEWLNTKAKTSRENYKTIFYRSIPDELELVKIDANSKKSIQASLNPGALVVTLGAMLKVKELEVVRDWFYNMKFSNSGDPLTDYLNTKRFPAQLENDLEYQREIVAYLSTFDPSIKGFRVEESQKGYNIYAVHHPAGGKSIELPLEQESDGTLKMFEFYPIIQSCLKNGSVMVVDELNSKLHPLLIRNLLLTFLNPEVNKYHAQLIFTSHDVWQLSNSIMRRDEIWFTEKIEDETSSLYSLADFVDEDGDKIRKDANYEKNYLLGRYGAIPKLSKIDVFREA
jgi:AAA15 family ATPase/GTPase